MPWPARDLFEEDRVAAPLLSPFATGSGVDKFLSLVDTPNDYSGQAGLVAAVNTAENALEFISAGGFKPDNVYWVSPAGDLTSFDDVAYTDIQTALDAANTAGPTVTDQYVVFVMPGNYSDTTTAITMYQYVHLVGVGGGASGQDSGRLPVQIGLGLTSAVDAFTGAPDSTVSNIAFYSNGQTSHTTFMLIDDEDCTFYNCAFTNSNAATPLTVGRGNFINCWFKDCEMTTGGVVAEPSYFSGCDFEWNASPTKDWSSSSGYTLVENCRMIADLTHTASDFLNITTANWKMIGGSITSLDGADFTFEGQMIGVYLYLELQASLASQVRPAMNITGGATFTGCRIEGVITTSGNTGTVGIMNIDDFASGDVVFTGCHFTSNGDNALLMLDSSISQTSNQLILSGNTFDADDVPSQLSRPIAIHSSGFSGSVVVVMNGNTFVGNWSGMGETMPANAGSGRVEYTGSDIKNTFYKVDGNSATLSGLVDNYPIADLDAAAEVAYITGRVMPQADIFVDAHLVLSAENSDGKVDLTFTDADSTPLATHDADWTVQAGSFTIQSNAVQSGTTGINIATHAHGARNGFAYCTPTIPSGSGTRYGGIVFRWADSSNYWRLVMSDDSPRLQLIKRVAGSETTMHSDSTATAPIAVSFVGNRIRVWENYTSTTQKRLVVDIEDSDLATNTGVGIYTNRSTGTHPSIDNYHFTPGGTCDLTIDTQHGIVNEPWRDATSADDDEVDVLHHGQTLHPLDSTPLTGLGLAEGLWSVKVTLDVLDSPITDVFVHGVVVRHLNIQTRHGSFASESHTAGNGHMFR